MPKKKIKEQPEEQLKEFIVDLGSFSVMAADEDEAYDKAMEMINDKRGGWVEIDQIIPND